MKKVIIRERKGIFADVDKYVTVTSAEKGVTSCVSKEDLFPEGIICHIAREICHVSSAKQHKIFAKI